MSLIYRPYLNLRGGHIGGILTVSFSPRGTFIATGGDDGRFCVFSGSEIQRTPSCVVYKMEQLLCVMLTPKPGPQSPEHNVVASGAKKELRVWQYRDSRQGDDWILQKDLPDPPKSSDTESLDVVVTSIHWLNRTDLLVTYMQHGMVVFDSSQDWAVRSLTVSGLIASASISPSKDRIVLSNIRNGFDIYNLNTRSPVHILRHQVASLSPVPAIFLHDGYAVLGGTTAGQCYLWDATNGHVMHSLQLPSNDIEVFAVSAYHNPKTDAFYIATGIMPNNPIDTMIWKAEDIGMF
ncbi:hypothetical protein EUX98_g8710 [Antrodiella citrinella]|uniref:Uncharacterized protein n=1 Tax=Antrodiella citrinella TaxID=2447956 RepID=A0A4S4M5J7_9APHY|nr:hypothetical protein EUX98_g8710 [Antrodiella citrinella]